MKKKLLISIAVGLLGLAISFLGAYLEPREAEASLSPRLYNRAVAAYESERYLDAYRLFFEAGLHTEDPELGARITYNMATLLLEAKAPVEQTVVLYQDSLRADPTEEAAFNLEWLYDRLMRLTEGEGQPGGGNEEGRNTYGDI